MTEVFLLEGLVVYEVDAGFVGEEFPVVALLEGAAVLGEGFIMGLEVHRN